MRHTQNQKKKTAKMYWVHEERGFEEFDIYMAYGDQDGQVI